MAEHRIERTGQTALSFRGEELASVSGHYHAGQQHNRHYDLAVYKTVGSHIIVAASYKTSWQGEDDQYGAIVVSGLEEVPATLRQLKDWLDERTASYGFPPGEQFDEKRARLRAQLRNLWEVRVGQLLGKLKLEERVE